jgi:predicted mannosyl-3-phosphoglycerate phosphatase (HAD superfamily)
VTWRVVSDVDHTLLEEPGETPSAGQALRQLGQRGIPTLLASSKTFAEMVAFQSLADLPPQPFLFENGCGIGWPTAAWPAAAPAPQQVLDTYGAIVRGGDPQRLRTLLHQLRDSGGLRFSLLEELNFDSIQQLIGLEEPLARLALQRLASMPLVWQDDEAALERLRRQLAGDGLEAVTEAVRVAEWRKVAPSGTVEPSVIEATRKELERYVAAFSKLARFAPFVAGDTFTMADCSAIVSLPLISGATKAVLGADVLAATPTRDYVKQMGERASVQKVNADRKANLELRAAMAAKK